LVDVAGGRCYRLDVHHVSIRLETREENTEAQERRQRFIFQKKIGFLKGIIIIQYNLLYSIVIHNRYREKYYLVGRQVPTEK